MKTGRNDPCPCGSGLKFKKCCQKEAAAEVASGVTPVELVGARVRAFRNKNFSFIYETYHTESYFRRQFPDKEAYVRQGRQALSADHSIREYLIIKNEETHDEARVIFYLDILFQGVRQESFELAFFYRENGEWRYHSSQKMTRADYPGKVEEIDWSDFERVKEKVFF